MLQQANLSQSYSVKQEAAADILVVEEPLHDL